MRRWTRTIASVASGALVTTLLVAPTAANEAPPAEQIALVDLHGRTVNSHGVTLVDWPGYVENPYIELTAVPPPGSVYPLTVTVRATGTSRLMLDTPSTLSATGASKTLTLTSGAGQVFRLRIAPDRGGGYGEIETYALDLTVTDGTGRSVAQPTVPIHVLDLDDDGEPTIPIWFDYRLDTENDNFALPGVKDAAEAAVRDWFYFFDIEPFDTVPVGAETINAPVSVPSGSGWTWGTDTQVANDRAYDGMWVVLKGLRGPHSTGWPTFRSSSRHTRDGQRIAPESGGLFRSIGTALHWDEGRTVFTSLEDEDWYLTEIGSGLRVIDVYGLIMHEFGHGIAYHSAWPGMRQYVQSGGAEDERVIAYQGHPVPVIANGYHISDQSQHWDRLSGATGGWTGMFPIRRWTLTKQALLIARNVGWPLREELAVFAAPEITTTALPATQGGLPYRHILTAHGGVPFYDWQVTGGQLPPGLSLDRFTGAVTGTVSPLAAGSYAFVVQLADHDPLEPPVSRTLTIDVAPSGEPLPPDTTAPTVTVTANPPGTTGGWRAGPVTVTVAAFDDRDPEPVVEYRRHESAAWTSYTGPIVVAEDGAQLVQVRARDAAGNVSTVHSHELLVDATPPTVLAGPDAERRLVIDAHDAGSGLTAVEYRIGTGPWLPYTGPVSFGSWGAALGVRATDVVGNVSPVLAVEIAALPGDPARPNLAPAATVSASYTAAWNALAAVQDGAWRNTGGEHHLTWGTWSGSRPATQWLAYTWSEPQTVARSELAFWTDSDAGTGEGVAVPASWRLEYLDGTDGWLPVIAPSGYGTDRYGVQVTTFEPVTTTGLRAVFQASGNGTTYSAVGVSEWAVHPEPPDTTPPELVVSLEPDVAVSDWVGRAVTVTATATDNRTASPQIEYRLGAEGAWSDYTAPIVLTSEGVHGLDVRARDEAGNTSPTVVQTVRIDLTPPTATARIDTQRRLEVSATDAGSGVTAVEYRLGTGTWQRYSSPVPLGPQATSASYRATDAVGHVSAVRSLQVPAVTPPPGAQPGTVATRLALTGAVTRSRFGTRNQIAVTVRASGAVPTGRVELRRGSRVLARATVRSGTAVLTLKRDTLRTVRSYALSVRYLPTSGSVFAPARRDVVHRVLKARTTVTTRWQARPTAVRAGVLRVQVSNRDQGLRPRSGRITVRIDGRLAATTRATGTKTLRVRVPALRSPSARHTVTVRYQGSTKFHASRRVSQLRASLSHSGGCGCGCGAGPTCSSPGSGSRTSVGL